MNANASSNSNGTAHGACHDALACVAKVPPSVQSVYCAMYGHAPMTGQQLRDSTHLPRRTVYAALQKLKELGMLNERPSLRDTRQTYYWVAGTEGEQATVAAAA
ncbi:MAG: helix-turn-helix domain-containing protein [Candidatus Thermoplasmatota archaeon]